MEYSIRRLDTHLEVKLSGVPTLPDVRAMLHDLARQRGDLRCALLEVKVAMGLDFVGTQALLDETPQFGLPIGFRYAVLLLDEQARRSAEFAQVAAENRGVPVQVFSDREAALKWLLS
jgi:hypothetical protein